MKDFTRNRLKLFFTSFLFLLPFLNISQATASKKYRINVTQVIQHPALDNSRKGIYDELIEQGMKQGSDFEWIYDNAQGNVSVAAQISQKAVSGRADTIVTLGTMVTQAALNATKGSKIPVVFASVTDPVGSKIVKSLELPGGNATGVSNLTPAKPQFEMFMKLQPKLKKLGIIYSPGEPNSVALNEEMKKAATEVGIELVFATASKTSEVPTAATKLLDKVDAYYINNDGPSLAAFSSIVRVAISQHKPVYVSDTDMVELGGALAALGPDQYDLGRQVGRMLVKILKGEKPESIPVEFAKNVSVVINYSMAQRLGIDVPEDLKKQKQTKNLSK